MDKITFLLFHCINKRSMVLFSYNEKLVMNTAEAKCRPFSFCGQIEAFPLQAYSLSQLYLLVTPLDILRLTSRPGRPINPRSPRIPATPGGP